jgi:fructokinase
MITGARRIFCIGETVLDVIFRDNKPVAANPGGSMLNSAISLGRAGAPVYFISDFARDHTGNLIHDFLLKNGIATDYISRYQNGQTSLALAFLDNEQNADYSFYKTFPEERITIPLPAVQPGDIILFGSFYALTRSVRSKLVGFIQSAKSVGAFIIYDPNFRRAHLGELDALRPWIVENISLSNLVRGSDEDFSLIFSAADANQAFQHISGAGCPSLVYTRNSREVEVISTGFSKSYQVPKLIPVSTIGAGDAFNAGMIYGFCTLAGSTTLTGSEWDLLIASGIQFSSDVCQNMDNYISIDLGIHLKNRQPDRVP